MNEWFLSQRRLERSNETYNRWRARADRSRRRRHEAEIVAIDGSGAAVLRRRVPTPRGSYEGTLEAIRSLVADAETQVGRSTVGIGMPGAISPATGLVKNANSTWLIGRPFGVDLSAVLAREVRLANDANCLALSEATDGAAAGRSPVFGVILGTGVGGGLAIDGRIVVGANAVGGEWGHNPMPWPTPAEWPGPACYCGKTGCIETLLSGPGLERDYAQAAGSRLSALEISAAATAGESRALETLRRYRRPPRARSLSCRQHRGSRGHRSRRRRVEYRPHL